MNDRVRKMIQELARKEVATTTILATVISVSEDNYTCDVQPVDDGAEIFTVRLRSIISSAAGGFVCFPKVGSLVLVSLIQNNDQSTFISQYSEVDKIYLNGKEFNGLVKVDELKAELEKVKAFMKAVQTAFNIWEVASGDGGAVLKGLSSGFTGLALPDTTDLENETVKHGAGI